MRFREGPPNGLRMRTLPWDMKRGTARFRSRPLIGGHKGTCRTALCRLFARIVELFIVIVALGTRRGSIGNGTVHSFRGLAVDDFEAEFALRVGLRSRRVHGVEVRVVRSQR